MPEISIITPIYAEDEERVDWLIEMIESLSRQTFTDWEVVIIDDGSLVSLDRAKIQGDERLRWFTATNQSGPSLARNTAVALAVGQAILPLDADDQLAGQDTLQVMVDVWRGNKDKIIYGDLQRSVRISPDDKEFRLDRRIPLPEYSFPLTLKEVGLMPVTAMHSKESHLKAGGWTDAMEFGLEDVEYLIKLGKMGVCGLHIPHTTLLYRRHSDSRHQRLSRDSHRYRSMVEKMKEIHQDVYEGRYPVSCCGGRGAVAPVNNSGAVNPPAQMQAAVVQNQSLDQYPAQEKSWVRYKGKRSGAFGLVGPFTNISYQIHGPDSKILIHERDKSKFRQQGRGRDFEVDVAPPEEIIQIEVSEIQTQTYQPGEPTLARVERLDRVAAEAQGLDLPPMSEPGDSPGGPIDIVGGIIETWVPEPEIEEIALPGTFDLSALDLQGNLQDMLQMENWTVEALARAKISELVLYKGIGQRRAEIIINKAQELLTDGQS